MQQWYKCPKCGQDIQYVTNPCPYCKWTLDWRQQQPIPYMPPSEAPQQQAGQSPVYAQQQQVVQPAANLQSTKKTTNPLVIVLAVIGGIVLLFGTCAICVGSFTAKPSTSVPGSVQTQNTEPPIYISASELYNEYKDNEVAADMKYKGKIVVVNGIVGEVGKDIVDTPYISLTGGGQYEITKVQCMFSDKDLNRLATISKGSSISIQGTCTWGKLFWPLLQNCSIK